MLFSFVSEVLFLLLLSGLGKFSLTCSDFTLSFPETCFYSFLFFFFFFLICILFLQVEEEGDSVLGLYQL